MNSNADGLLDTNIFIRAHTTDRLSEECIHFLAALEAGELQARLEPMVLHELSYTLRNYMKQMDRGQIAEYLLLVLSWNGVQGEKELMADTVERWRDTPGPAFVDAYFAALAARRRFPSTPRMCGNSPTRA